MNENSFSMFKSPAYSIFYCLFIFAIFLLSACANIVPPTGGPKDTRPPKLLHSNPKDSLLETKVNKIVFTFDKNMDVKDLNENLNMSPLLPFPPEVLANRKKVIIEIPDSLIKDNTTYFFDFGKAITDNREGTAAENLQYTFSTGSYFDSLSIKGRIIRAEDGMPDSSATVILHSIEASDSAILSKRPEFASRTDAKGYFEIKMLPDRPYKLYAIRENSIDYLWNASEEGVAFFKEDILANNPSDFKNSYLLYSFSNITEEEENKKEEEVQGLRKKTPQKLTEDYKVLVDTSGEKKQDLYEELFIIFKDSAINLDIDKILLTYDREGTEIESIISSDFKADTLKLKTEWKEDTNYTLRLVSSWAKNHENEDLKPGKYTFTTKAKKDYANLIFKFTDTFLLNNYRMLLIQKQDTINELAISEAVINIPNLKAENFDLYIYLDANDNKKWDTGNFWEKQQPELMFPVLKDRPLRAGWDNEFTIEIWEDPKQEIQDYFEAKTSKGGLREKADKNNNSEDKEEN